MNKNFSDKLEENATRERAKWLKDYYQDDITFCAKEDCTNTDCFRNMKNIANKEILHSFSMFEGSQYCPSIYGVTVK